MLAQPVVPLTLTVIESVAAPPVCVSEPVTFVLAVLLSSCFAPTTKRSLKSGVLLLPSHNTQPLGIVAIVPDQRTITPVGMVVIPVKFAPLTAGKVAGNLASGIVPDVKLLALKAVKSTVPKDSTPEPFVFKYCPLVPSSGSV